MTAPVPQQAQPQKPQNTSTVGQNPVMDSKFTRAEVAQQGLIRSIDRKMNEMNEQKSQVIKSSLREVLLDTSPSTSSDFLDNRSFSSTQDLNQVPQKVRDILEFHDVYFTDGDRIIHIPGANYFHVLHYEGDQKQFTMFSLDEEIPSTPEELSEESGPVSASEIIEPEVPIGTLGTLGYQPEPQTVTVPIAPVPTAIEIPTEREPAFITEMKSEPVKVVEMPETPLLASQKTVDTKRAAASREFSAYMSNTYRDKISGSYSELFGNNTAIAESIFKTIRDYNAAKLDYLKELAKTSPEKSVVIDWLRKELVQLSLLLPHDRLHLFTELAHVFNTDTSTTLETRNRIITTMPATAKVIPIAERLGIHSVIPPVRPWELLFIHEKPKELPISRITSTPSVVIMAQPEISEQPVVPERVINKRVLFNKVFPFLKNNFGLGQMVMQNPIVSPIPQEEPVAMSVPGKQHPEQLFA